MSAAANADPGSSPAAVDPISSSSTQQGVGDEAENHADENTREVEKVVDRSDGEGVPVIKPALVYTKEGDIVEVAETVVEAVDGFRVPDGFVRKGAREDSYMYSLGVYCEKRDSIDHKYFCLADSVCRRAKKAIPCKKGDRSNVNTHLKAKHNMQGTGGVKKDAKKQQAKQSIQACFNASRNSGVGTNRCVQLQSLLWQSTTIPPVTEVFCGSPPQYPQSQKSSVAVHHNTPSHRSLLWQSTTIPPVTEVFCGSPPQYPQSQKSSVTVHHNTPSHRSLL